MIRNKVHERYYLKVYFDQTPKIDLEGNQLIAKASDPNNYLEQNGMFKLK